MYSNLEQMILHTTHSVDCKETRVIQSLWSGYGKISRYELHDSALNIETVVVKCIDLKNAGQHPRGWNTSYSHNRKIKSYEVEMNWYENFSKLCSTSCKVPTCYDCYSTEGEMWIVMEDLSADYPVVKKQVHLLEIQVCLKWLAHFHSTFLGKKPTGLWDVGTYWHLQTRPDELAKMNHKALQSKAEVIDSLLNQCTYQTFVHGDAKLANFCFSKDGRGVAAVDFQYVGGGCGMKDVAYFLGSCLSEAECLKQVDGLLDYYFLELEKAIQGSDIKVDFVELQNEWKGLFAVAWVDFIRFLLGWMPTHQKVNGYNLGLVEEVLENL